MRRDTRQSVAASACVRLRRSRYILIAAANSSRLSWEALMLLRLQLESGEAQGPRQTHCGAVFGLGKKLPRIPCLDGSLFIRSFANLIVAAFFSSGDCDQKFSPLAADCVSGGFHLLALLHADCFFAIRATHGCKVLVADVARILAHPLLAIHAPETDGAVAVECRLVIWFDRSVHFNFLSFLLSGLISLDTHNMRDILIGVNIYLRILCIYRGKYTVV